MVFYALISRDIDVLMVVYTHLPVKYFVQSSCSVAGMLCVIVRNTQYGIKIREGRVARTRRVLQVIQNLNRQDVRNL
jgi:hypothetical protein